MSFYELIGIAIGLSMDAFAVSISKGLQMPGVKRREAVLIGLWFGVFQAGMPLIGYLLGTRFRQQIEAVDHWVAFVILGLIGSNMIREAIRESAEEPAQEPARRGPDLRVRTMALLAVATSIDALAVGITLALLQVRIVPSALFIGGMTFGISFAGVYVGRMFGARFKKSAALAGGVLLIAIGLKILLEHLGIPG